MCMSAYNMYNSFISLRGVSYHPYTTVSVPSSTFSFTFVEMSSFVLLQQTPNNAAVVNDIMAPHIHLSLCHLLLLLCYDYLRLFLSFR